MLKHVYRAIILVAIFVGAFFLMSKNIKEEKVDVNTTVKLSNATFPILYLQSMDQKINTLHGYSSNIDANLLREGITPLDDNKSFVVLIDEKENKVKKIKYEVREVYKNNLIETGSISNFKEVVEGKSAKIIIKADLEQNKEYTVQMTLITNTSKKIKYYTRVKSIQDPHLKEKLNFAMDFHNSIMDKKKAKEIIAYLEPDVTKVNSNLCYVNINSSFDLISWGNLKPTVVGEIIPIINEINDDTASIQLKYVVSADTSSGTEIYNVKEFYRVRWTATRMYLLNYERTMESNYKNELVSLNNNELKAGITSDTDLDIITNNKNNKLCFVRERALWYYDLSNNSAVNVFSFMGNKTQDIRASYDQHNIKILNMDEDGNTNFIVYGYMNRGDYEGKVAIVLYKFYSEEKRIEEQVYIPIDVPYQILNQDLDQFSYVNKSEVFYFSMNNTIYSYNMGTKSLNEIASNIDSDQLAMSKDGKYIAWQDSKNPTKTRTINILDLETEEKKTISAPEGNNIKILGDIAQNIIYGYAETADITKTTDGNYMIPLNKIEIAGSDGEVVKTYEKKGYYITKATVKDNIVELDRVKKDSDEGKTTYEKVSSDYIINNVVSAKDTIKLSSKTSSEGLSEAYIVLPSKIIMEKVPNVSETINTIITEDTTLLLTEKKMDTIRYYVYAAGGIEASYNNVSDAIIHANERFGVVINNKQQIIWERGGKQVRSEITGITPTYVDGSMDSIGACLAMLLHYNKLDISNDTLIDRTDSIYDLLNKNLKYTTLNLTGCSLDEVLYYVSDKYPVIAMKDKNHAVLITSYDEFNITVIDPSSGGIKKIGLNDGSDLFKNVGNIFISYIQ